MEDPRGNLVHDNDDIDPAELEKIKERQIIQERLQKLKD